MFYGLYFFDVVIMLIIDGWNVSEFVGYTWGLGWFSIFFIIISIFIFLAAYFIKRPLIIVIFLYLVAIFSLVCACHMKPITKNIIEYKIECNDEAKVNDFFDRFELQKVIDDTHYIVRQKNWKDFN